MNNAAALHGASATRGRGPGGPLGFIPAVTPEARNPQGTHAHGNTPAIGSAVVSSKPDQQVQVLDRLAGRALHEVVDRAGDDRRARSGVDDRLELDDVRAADALRVDHLAGREDADERSPAYASRAHR